MTDVIRRNNVRVHGGGAKTMIFAHGFGCDQNMWRFVAPAFEPDFRTVLFDHVGAGGSDLTAYDKENIPSSPATPKTWWKSAAHSNCTMPFSLATRLAA